MLLLMPGSGFRTAAEPSLVDSAEALERVSHVSTDHEPVEGRRSGGGAAVGPGVRGRVIPRSMSPWRDRRSMMLGEGMGLGAPRIVS